MRSSTIPTFICALLVAFTSAMPAVAADQTPPTIDHTAALSTAPSAPMVVRATIKDPAGIFDPSLVYRLNGEGEFQRTAMVPVPGEDAVFVATVPAAVMGEGVREVEYFIEAYDNEGNGPTTFGTEAEPVLVVVKEATAPTPPPGEVTPTAPDSGATTAPPPGPGETKPEVEEDESEGSGVGLWLGIGAGVAGVVIVAAAVAAAGVGAYFYFTRPDTLDEVTISVSGPSPVAVP